MATTSFTNKQVHSIASLGATEGAAGTRDFTIACTSTDTDAIHALYYLPQNFKLMIVDDAGADDMPLMPINGQISFQHNTGQAANTSASPYSFADAVIFSGGDTHIIAETKPHVIVSGIVEGEIAGDSLSGFTVSAGNPEALATALLRVARSLRPLTA